MTKELSSIDAKIAQLMTRVHAGDYDKNTSLSKFNTDVDATFMMKMGLHLQGWSRDHIIEKVKLDTYNDLTSKGYKCNFDTSDSTLV